MASGKVLDGKTLLQKPDIEPAFSPKSLKDTDEMKENGFALAPSGKDNGGVVG